MDAKKLDRIFSLIDKTGDKIIFSDNSGDDFYVLMRLSDYESLISRKSGVEGLTEDELLAKINHDIAIWKNEQEMEAESNISEVLGSEDDSSKSLLNVTEDEKEEDRYYLEPV